MLDNFNVLGFFEASWSIFISSGLDLGPPDLTCGCWGYVHWFMFCFSCFSFNFCNLSLILLLMLWLYTWIGLDWYNLFLKCVSFPTKMIFFFIFLRLKKNQTLYWKIPEWNNTTHLTWFLKTFFSSCMLWTTSLWNLWIIYLIQN